MSKEALKHLEDVFRSNLGKDKEEFTLTEIKKIVPSKNVSNLDLMEKQFQLTQLYVTPCPLA